MKKYTKKEMIKHLKKHYLKNPKITVKSFDEDKTVCCSRTVLTKFESWDKALEAAGIGKRVQLLRLLLEHYSENPNMTYDSFNKENKISILTIRKEFGSWDRALIESGIRKEGDGRLSKEEVIRQLKEHYLKTEKITIRSFSEDKSTCAVETVRTKFGSWKKALIEAKILSKEEDKREKLLEQLRKHHSRNRRMTYKSFNNDKTTIYSSRTVVREFGTWNKALLEAGIKIKKSRYILQ